MYGVMGMAPPQAAVDHVKEVFGTVAPTATTERKVKEKQQRLAYGNQLQQQMAQQQEAKKRERNERMGIAPAGGMQQQQQPPAYQQQSFIGMAAPYQPMQPYAPPPLYQPMQQQQQQQQQQHGPAPGYGPPGNNMMGMGYNRPPELQPPMLNPMMPPPGPYGPPSPNSYGPPSPNGGGGGGGGGGGMWNNNFGAPMPPGMLQPAGAGWNPAVGPGNMANVQKAVERAHKDQYRAELEAQMRAKEERKRMEKEASLNEARARQAAMVAQDYANAMGRMGGGGGGGPMGQDLNAMRGFQQAREREQQMMMGGGGGGGPPPGAFGYGGPPPPLQMMGAGVGPGGMGGPNSPPGGGMMGPPQQGPQQGPGPEAMNPNYRFRSDNAYMTPAELDSKARQRAELQDALERQIAEKKYKKDMEKAARQEELMREDQRLKAEQERLRSQYQQEHNRENGKDTESKEDKVAAAWQRAKDESEAAKKTKYGERRAQGLRASQELSDLKASEGTLITDAHTQQFQHNHMDDITRVMPQQLVMAAPSTPMVAEKVKQLAAQEIQKVRAEMQAEAASLRSVVAEQSAQVAALRQHAERMESQAENAQAKVTQMRVDLIRNSMAAPESLMHMMSDYPMQPRAPPPPAMLDIALDLPPPAAVQRRTLPPQPIYDMGPLIPPIHNPNEADQQLQRDFMSTPGRERRPPTQGLRTINPLEASLAAESVFIYPGGRELQRTALPANGVSAATHASSNLPFKSLALSPGRMGSMAEGSLQQGAISPGSPGASLQQSSVLLSAARVQAALGASMESLNGADHSMPIRHMDGDTFNTAPIPPATADAVRRLQSQLREEASAAAAAAATAQTPMDVESLMQQNKDKLSLLQELSALSAGDSAAAIDAFLTKFSRTRPGLPERTRTPLLRVNTPTKASPSAGSGHYSVGTYHSSYPQQQQQQQQQSPAVQRSTSLGREAPRSPILFTDNMHSAAPSADGSRRYSKPGTPTVGDYLDPQSLLAKDMKTLPRVPSYGRRAGSAGSQGPGSASGAPLPVASPGKPPESKEYLPRPGAGEDTLDQEMRRGLGSRPGSGAGPTGSRPPSGMHQQASPPPGLPRSSSRPHSGTQPQDGALSGMPIPATSLSRQNSIKAKQ